MLCSTTMKSVSLCGFHDDILEVMRLIWYLHFASSSPRNKFMIILPFSLSFFMHVFHLFLSGEVLDFLFFYFLGEELTL